MKKILSIILALSITVALLPACMVSAAANVEPMIHMGAKRFAVKNDGSLWLIELLTSTETENGEWGTEAEKIADDVVCVQSCWNYIFILKKDNTLWWSKYTFGGEYDRKKGFSKFMDDVKAFDCTSPGSNHNNLYVVKTDGRLLACGIAGHGGIIGIFDHTKDKEWRSIMTDVETVSASGKYVLATKEDNSLWAWGWGAYPGNDKNIQVEDAPVKIMEDVKKAYAGSFNAVIKTDNTLWAWGDKGYPNKGPGTSEYNYQPVKIMDNVADFSIHNHIRAVKTDGSLWYWRDSDDYDDAPMQVEGVYDAVDVECVDNSSFMVIRKDKSLWGNLPDGFKKFMQLCGFAIDGENVVAKDTQTVLTATYYGESGIPQADPNVTWYCSDTSIAQVAPSGNKLTVRGLKPGKVTIEAVHNASGEVASFELEVLEYSLSLENVYNFLIDTKKNLEYSVMLGDHTVGSDKNVVWTVEGDSKVAKVVSDNKTDDYSRNLYLEFTKSGNCELVAKIDGAEAARVKINVVGSIYDMVEDESIVRAKVLSKNMTYDYYKNRYKSTPIYYTENMNLTVAAGYGFLEQFFKNGIDFSNYYEAVLLDILTDKAYEEETNNFGGPLSDKMQQHMGMWLVKIAEDGEEALNPYAELIEDVSKVSESEAFKFSDFVEAAFLAKDFEDGTKDSISTMSALGVNAKATVDALDKIKSATDNGFLQKACDNVKARYTEIINDDIDAKCKQIADGGLAPLKETAFSSLAAAVISAMGGAWAVTGTGVGSAVNNLLLNTDETTAQAIVLSTYVELEEVMKNALTTAQSGFEKNQNLKNATDFMALADLYKAMLVKGCESTKAYVSAVEEGDKNIDLFWGPQRPDSFFGLFEKDIDYKGAKEIIDDRIRVLNNSSFYSLDGVDIAEIISEVRSTEPSEWAKAEINEAISKEILPEYLQCNYTENITRAEFCTLLTKLLEKKSGMDIDTLVKEKGVQIKSPFEDTYYEYVDYIYKLGIVNGTGENRFDPLENITREQAATMLTRAADVLGYDTAYQNAVESGISDWASDGVGFVTENGIMNGTGEGFSPKGTYTKEQAIATFVRMYNNLK